MIVFGLFSGCSEQIIDDGIGEIVSGEEEIATNTSLTAGERNIISNEKIFVAEENDYLYLPFEAWSDDGESFMFRKYDAPDSICTDWYSYDLNSDDVESIVSIFKSYIDSVSPDGKWTASLSGTGDVVVTNNDTNISELIPNSNWFRESARCDDFLISWSPDSTKFYVKDGLMVFSVETFDKLFKIPSNSGWRWSPDSQSVAGMTVNVTSEKGWISTGSPVLLEFYILDANGQNRQDITSIEGYNKDGDLEIPWGGFGFDWSPDSQYIVYGSNGALYLVNLQTMIADILVSGEGTYLNPRWSQDGQKILYQIDSQIWMITFGY